MSPFAPRSALARTGRIGFLLFLVKGIVWLVVSAAALVASPALPPRSISTAK